jgi:hypothetical protein
MRRIRVRFTLRTMMVAVAGLAIALGVSRRSPPEILHVYEMSFLGLIGLAPILTCYLWLRESSASIETLLGRVAVVLALGLVFWLMVALWAEPF